MCPKDSLLFGDGREFFGERRLLRGLCARDGDASTVIVCPTEPGRSLLSSGAFWDLGVPEVADDEAVRRRTADHLEARVAQRYLG